MLIDNMKDKINVCRRCHNSTLILPFEYVFTTYANMIITITFIIIDANQNVRKLIGHANVFNIHLIGELKIRNINQRTKNAQMMEMIESHIPGNVIFIPMFVGCQSGQVNSQFIQLRKYNNAPDIMTFAIRFFISFIDCYNM